MPAIRIRVGATIDNSLLTSLRPFEQAAKRARAVVAAEMRGARDATSKAADEAGKKAAKAMGQIADASEKAAHREVAAADKAAQQKVRAAQREFDQRLRLSQRAAAAEEKDILRVAATAEKADARRAASASRTAGARNARSARNIGYGSVSNIGGVYRAGVGLAGELARGAGVDTSIGSLVGKSVSLEKTATDATNSAFAAKGKEATPADVKATMEAIRSAGDAAAVDFNKLGQGLLDFVAKSADLDTAKQSLAGIGNIARATGSDVGDLVSAAGDVNKMLADSPHKAEELLAIMRLIAKQSALGNVEVRDYAQYMGRITASAPRFEGGIDKNIGTLGALAQVAMKGGATNGAEATNSAQAFARDLTKGAALKRFEKAGIDVFADKGKTKLRDPAVLIPEIIKATKGSQAELANLFKNDVSKRVVQGFSNIYDAAGGGAAGLRAVEEEFKKYSTTMSQAEVDAKSALSKGGKEGQVQAFNNNMERAAASLADKLLPAMERAAPLFERLVGAVGSAVAWAADNPGQAIAAAIVLSITKATIGEAVSRALASVLMGALGAGAGGGGGGLVGLASAAGATAITITAVGAAIAGAFGWALADQANQKDKRDAATMNAADRAGGNLLEDRSNDQNNTSRKDTKFYLNSKRNEETGEWELNRSPVQTLRGGTAEGGGVADVVRRLTGSWGQDGTQDRANAERDKSEAILVMLTNINTKLGGQLKIAGSVDVSNMPAPTVPGVDESRRSGP